MNNNPIFDEFEKGEATKKIFKGVYSGQIFEADELNVEDIKTAVNLNNRPIFIDGVVHEAQNLDIETKTPAEIERIKNLWKA